ncbi:hypothetical protein BOX15_Mlig000889g4, partial [Macrostomum lignano]
CLLSRTNRPPSISRNAIMSGGGGGGGGAFLNSLAAEKPLCPRLADYLVLVGARLPAKQNSLAQTPQLLRRYPPQDHRDFHLPPDIVFFCQPEGCLATGPKRRAAAGSGGSSGSRECSTFVFTLTEKDSGLVRYGICHNFYRPIDRRWTAAEAAENGGGSAERVTSRSRSRLLTSLCLVSHHPFFSRFRECLQVLRRIVNACSERSQAAGRTPNRETVWSVLTGLHPDSSSQLVMHDVREIETWILRLLSAPVPVPGRTKLQLTVLPEADYPPLVFALPDRSRLSLADFPLHLPLELLGVDTCLRVLTCILLENKLVLQSRDENALTMSVMAFVAMLYPMQYMFPVIPLLPTCMMSAEQLLLAPTPYIIGLPASFLLYKKNFCLPPDVWLVDLDANKIVCAQDMGKLPSLPEPEGSQLRSQLQQALAMMNEAAQQQPIKNLDTVANQDAEFLTCHHQQPTPAAVASGNDVDSVDVAARVAMVRFFNSPNVLGNFAEHTRTLRLYPRPVVAFQYFAFVQSRPRRCDFTDRLARTQAVEYFAEWSLCPDNCAFQRIHTGLTDPTAIGDKHKWFSQQLQRLQFSVCRQPPETCTLKLCYEPPNGDPPTDESGCSDSEPASSGAQPLPASTSYASLTDFVSEIISSDIVGDPNQLRQSRSAARLVIDAAEDAFQPPDSLQLPPSAAGRTGGEDSSGDNSSGEDTELTDSEIDERDDQVPAADGVTPVTAGRAQLHSQGSQGSATGPGGPPRPPRPPPPRRVGSVGSHPGTPEGAPRVSGPAFRFDRQDSSGSGGGSSTPTSTPGSARQQQQQQAHSEETGGGVAHALDSFIAGLSDNLGQQAGSAIGELLGGNSGSGGAIGQNTRLPHSQQQPQQKQFTPLGAKRSVVESSALMRQAQEVVKQREQQLSRAAAGGFSKAANAAAAAAASATGVSPGAKKGPDTSAADQAFLKDMASSVLDGQGVSFLKANRLRGLMENENYRNLLLSRLNHNLGDKLSDTSHDQHLADVPLRKAVFKGLLSVLRSMVAGLEQSFASRGKGGLASALVLLEVAHTHYWQREAGGLARNQESAQRLSPFGSEDSLSNSASNSAGGDLDPSKLVTTVGPPVVLNGEEYENIEVRGRAGSGASGSSGGGGGSSQDPMRDMLVQKMIGQTRAGVHPGGGGGGGSGVSSINHQLIRPPSAASSDQQQRLVSPAASTIAAASAAASAAVATVPGKSRCSSGYRYTGGVKVRVTPGSSEDSGRTYLFEMLVSKDRSQLWDHLQFWEDAFLDAVATERDIVGMDQGPNEMMSRYESLGRAERKRLELDEDRLLCTMLYNLTAFMVMMRVDPAELRKKIRRLLGKSHIGLHYSQQINALLDHAGGMSGNDVDLKPPLSRFMQKQSFAVHCGQDKTGDLRFLEVCDDCLILRACSGAIVDRWWYEKLVNMTFCPKTRVLILWRRDAAAAGQQPQADSTRAPAVKNVFYSKRCRDVYSCIRDQMARAAARTARSDATGQTGEFGGRYEVVESASGEHGILQVCMQGIGLAFDSTKSFIEMSCIKRCFVQQGQFIIEMTDPGSRQIKQMKFQSQKADQICYTVLCVFSCLAAGTASPSALEERRTAIQDG